jgi:hypothetical protein
MLSPYDGHLALEAQRWSCVSELAEGMHEVAPLVEAEMNMKAPSAFGHPIVRLYMARIGELALIRDISCLAAAISGLNAKARALRGEPPLG